MSKVTEWQKYSFKQPLPYVRGGWWGVWDAFVAAVRGGPRKLYTGEIEVSFMAKCGESVEFEIARVTATEAANELEGTRHYG